MKRLLIGLLLTGCFASFANAASVCEVKLHSADPTENLGSFKMTSSHSDARKDCEDQFSRWVKDAQENKFRKDVMGKLEKVTMDFVGEDGKDMHITFSLIKE